MYTTVAELEQLWMLFEDQFLYLPNPDLLHLDDIRKLMTAECVIDLSLHEIYNHAGFVHVITQKLLTLKNDHPDDPKINECCEHWLNLLKKRNEVPLKLKHHQRLDGECDFRFCLQLMEGRPSGFKTIQVLDRHNNIEVQEAIHSIHQLECLALGISFGDIPLVKDTVLSSLMEYEDIVCLIAKDQSDQTIGYCWGVLLRNVEVGQKDKANIFWVMDLAKYPDFVDATIKVGDQLRNEMVKHIKSRNDCDFVGYRHIISHKFHMSIIANAENGNEQMRLNNEEFAAKTALKYDEEFGIYVRAHFIKVNNNNYAYPEYDNIKPAILKAFWRAAHSAKDFLLGGVAFFSRNLYQKYTNNLSDSANELRLIESVSNEQQICDENILKKIILSDIWLKQGKGIFGAKHIPDTIDKLQALARRDDSDFLHIKSCVADSGKCVTRGPLTALLYNIISIANNPTFVLDRLLINGKTPKDWVELISRSRNELFRNHRLGS